VTCNLCHPLCQCGAEEAAAKQRLPSDGPSVGRFLESGRTRLLRDAARFPELEAMEAALANYDGAA
jgi:hypothetical protein